MSNFTVEDIPKILPTIPLPAVVNSSEIPNSSPDIPQSDAPPAGMWDQAPNPWDQQDEDFNQATTKWYDEGMAIVDEAVLDPDKAFKDSNLTFAETPEEAKQGLTVDWWMDLNYDEPRAPSNLLRDVQFQRASMQKFGQIASSEAELFSLIQKDVAGRRDTRELGKDLGKAANAAATMTREDLGNTNNSDSDFTFRNWKEQAKNKPGYDPKAEPEYFQAFHDVQAQVKATIDPFRPELDSVWKAFNAEENFAAVARTAYETLPDEQHDAFMAALSLRAKALPAKDQAAFWKNLGKQSGRDIGGYASGVLEPIKATLFDPNGTLGLRVSEMPEDTKYDTHGNVVGGMGKDPRAVADFVADVAQIQQTDYDPMKYLAKDGTWAQIFEKGAYGAPGAIVTSASAAIPGVGMAAFYLSSQEQIYQQYRQDLQARGATYQEASGMANNLAPIAAFPQVLMERLQIKAFHGKLPVLDKVLNGMLDKVSSRVARFGLRTVVGAAEEGTLENIQDLVPAAVQDIGHALEQDIPDVQWTGKGGALDGFWTKNAEMMVTMLPLAIFGAAGGISSDRRAQAFSNASTTELQAIGINAEGIAAINGAKGHASLNAAVDTAMETRDATTPEAKLAVEALQQQHAKTQQAQADLERLGYGVLPKIITRPDGTYAVHDGQTGEELGIAQDLGGVEKIVYAHTTAVEMMSADKVAEMATLLLSGQALSKLTGSENVFDLDHKFSVADMVAKNPRAADRIAEEVRLIEEAGGGTGDMALLVLGQHTTEMRQGLRQDVNTIFHGGHLGTLLEETIHGRWRAARAKGITTRADDIALIRAFDQVLAKRTNGKTLRFIPDGMADADVSEIRIEEAIGQLAQMEIFRTAKGGKNKFNLPRNVVSAHLGAVGEITGREKAWNFKSFIGALRARMGLVMSRAYAMKKAEKAGEFDYKTFDAYLGKLLGTDAQEEHDAGVKSQLADMLGIPGVPAFTEQEAAEAKTDGYTYGPVYRFGSGEFDLGKADPSARQGLGFYFWPKELSALQALGRFTMPHAGGFRTEDVQGQGLEATLQDLIQEGAVQVAYLKNPTLDGGEAFVKSADQIRLPREKATVVSEFDRILGLPEDLAGDDIPFSIGNAAVPVSDFIKDSKVVNDDGTPKIVYHGSPDVRGIIKDGFKDSPNRGSVFFFSEDYKTADTYADDRRALDYQNAEPHTLPVYLSLKNPMEVDAKGQKWRNTEKHIQEAKEAGHDGIVIINSRDEYNNTGTGGKAVTVYAVFSPTQIKSASMSSLKSRVDGIDLGKPAFSLGPANVAGIMEKNALSRITDPRRRTQVMSRIAKDFQAIRMDAERAGLDQWIGDTKGELRKKAAHMEELLAEQYVQEVETRRLEILSVDDLVKIKSQPVHAFLADPDSHLRGRLMSKAAAMAKRPDLFDANMKAGDYDGADGVSRSVFGGQLMPDQAAQELFDNHLIKAPTADAMWDALKKEQDTVASMKAMLAAAQEEIRAAKIRAKEEATAWAMSQMDLHGLQREESNKQAVTRGIRMLDAIPLAMPEELRGQIGGHAQMARLATHEARLKFLEAKLEKADKILENWLRDQARKDMEELLAKVRPEKNEEGNRPMGRLGPEIHSLFDFLEAAMAMNFHQTEAKIRELEAEADQLEEDADINNTNEEDAAERRYQAQLVSAFGNWPAADAHRRIEALAVANQLYDTGRSEVRSRAGIRKAMRRGWRESLVDGVGMTGERMERIRKAEKAGKTKISRLKQTVFSLFSYGQTLKSVFGEDPRAVFLFTERERRASQLRTDAESRIWDGIDELFTRLGGNDFKGDQLRAKLATERTITVTDFKGREQRFTSQEAITAMLMWNQEDGQRHMEGKTDEDGNPIDDWHWRQEDMDALRDQLSPEARAVMFHLREAYEAEYDRVNAVFRRMFEMNMPKHKFYSQLTVIPFQGSGAQAANPLSGALSGPGITAGSLKNRTQTKIAEPDFQDALQVFIGHTKQMEHFIHYGELAQDMGAVFNNREVGNAVQAKAGKEALSTLRGWANYFAQGGVRDEAAHLAINSSANRWIGRAARVALIGRVSVLAVQSLQLGAAAYQMPVGAYLNRVSRLFGGRLNWGDAIKSDYIQRRMKEMSPMVRLALEGFDGASPSRLNYLTHKMGGLINGADALFTAGTYAMILDYQLSINSGDAAAAHAEAERLTDQVAQPYRAGERSLFENTTTHPMARMMFAFRSDQRQKIGLTAYSLMSDATIGQKAKALAVTWIFGGILQTLLRSALRDIRNDDDKKWFDERYWDPKRLALMAITGPLGGVPYLGDVLEGGLAAAFGVQQPEGNLLSAPVNAARTVATRWDEWAEGDVTVGSGLKDAESIMGGLGVGGDIPAAAASWLHVAHDLWGIMDNFTDWGD